MSSSQFRTLIDSFEGDYGFLSNFSHDPVRYKGVLYNTSEHAFQAAKTNNPKEKEVVKLAATPFIAKKRGKKGYSTKRLGFSTNFSNERNFDREV